MEENRSRRRFIEIVVLGTVAAPLARTAHAADLPHVDPADPTASALAYTNDTTSVDAAKYPKHQPDQACANCNLALAPQADGWMPCQIFPGKSVNPKGWCAAWVKSTR